MGSAKPQIAAYTKLNSAMNCHQPKFVDIAIFVFGFGKCFSIAVSKMSVSSLTTEQWNRILSDQSSF